MAKLRVRMLTHGQRKLRAARRRAIEQHAAFSVLLAYHGLMSFTTIHAEPTMNEISGWIRTGSYPTIDDLERVNLALLAESFREIPIPSKLYDAGSCVPDFDGTVN